MYVHGFMALRSRERLPQRKRRTLSFSGLDSMKILKIIKYFTIFIEYELKKFFYY